ncbi:MAG: type VII secretion protein EssC [Defluviitaleaceae bacterium]|nr:type VII secretion protein EssC [Defluviitaleaceae bacterium]
MILFFHFNDYIFEYPLPSVNDRRIVLNLSEEIKEGLGVIHFEVWDNVWYLVAENTTEKVRDVVHLKANGKRVTNHALTDGEVINGKVNNTEFAIRVYKTSKSFTYYRKYDMQGRTKVEIGSGQTCDVIINDTYASRQHATIYRQNGHTFVRDHSSNGTYVQGKRIVGDYQLDIMDDIYIASIKIVYMGAFLAINHLHKCRISMRPLTINKTLITKVTQETADAENDGTLIRSPRVLESLDTEPVELESPPDKEKNNRRPIIFTIGPAVTMPIPIMAALMFNAQQGQAGNFMLGAIISVVMSALVATGWAIANMTYDKKQAKKAEEHRISSYTKYIAQNNELITQKMHHNLAVTSGQYLSLAEIMSVLAHNKAVLWNRNVNHPDFLTVRLGIGLVKSYVDIIIPKRKFSLNNDPMQEYPQKLQQKYSLMQNAVSLLNVKEMRVLGVIGAKKSVRHIATTLALQLSALHSYTDIKLAFLLQPGEDQHYSWAKPLPHVRWSENKLRLMAVDETQRQNVLFYLSGVLRTRIEEANDKSRKNTSILPHIVLFCTHPSQIIRENIAQYMATDLDLGITFVLLYEFMDRLPNECNHIIQYDSAYRGCYTLDKSRQPTNEVNFDPLDARMATSLASKIGNYFVTELATGEIPSAISFLEMYGVTSLADWELEKRWRENRAYESLRAMVGIGTDGKPLYLDIHEKQHGPHGLIAGTTGSGKSETIQTYILSLVLNFHPNEISLILIDYKGGGMCNAFLDLPHLAGTITNLDGNQTVRALLSIKAEIKRRQSLFNQFNVNHIDLYSRYFRDGTATEPMPHLIIISDEFAELKKEQPEFIKELISTARVGRSLGVHLILATQKPDGVVDEEIWSNSRFKVCLRVQDKQDSMGMLHRPDAAFLTHTGRAYMQIGNDEIFEMFQSGYSGAPYEPMDTSKNSVVTLIGLDGTELLKHKKTRKTRDDLDTQLDASVKFIRESADSLRIKNARQLWLPALEEGIILADIWESYALDENGEKSEKSDKSEKGEKGDNKLAKNKILFGLVDNPSKQLQYGATINLATAGNILIAGIPGSGKSTMVQTILHSIATNYTSEEINFYVIDCSGVLTKVFTDIPHCGAVVAPDDEDRITRLYALIADIMTERASLFEKASVGSYEEYSTTASAAKNPLPRVIFVTDNLFAFSERYPDLADENLLSLSQNCVKFGVNLLITVNHMSDVKFKLRQNFATMYPLRLAERGDYHDALGRMPEFMPSNNKGRGLFGAEALEYQVALPVAGENEQIRADNIRAELAKKDIYKGKKARAIKALPKNQTYTEFVESQQNTDKSYDNFYIGYKKEDVSVIEYPLSKLFCYAASAASRKGTEFLLNTITDYATIMARNVEYPVKKYLIELKHETTKTYDTVYKTAPEILNIIVLIRDSFAERHQYSKTLEKSANVFTEIRKQFGLIFVFIDSMNDFINTVYDVKLEDEEHFYPTVEMLLKGGKGYGIYFIAGFEPNVYTANAYKEVYKLFTQDETGIHVGGRLDQQKLINIPFLTREQMNATELFDGVTVIDEQMIDVFIPNAN